MRFCLLRCLAKAVVKHAGKFLFSLVPGGEAVYDIATDAFEEYHRSGQEDSLRTEVQALAQAPAEQVRQEVQAAVQAEAADLPPDAQQTVAAYLMQVPAMIRRSLRRPSDATGTTVPATRSLSCPEDIVPFLPSRRPRFKPGDRPLPGVDWVLEELVGVGGFGEVWKARHAHFDGIPPVALKFCIDPAARDRLLRHEAAILNQVMRHGRNSGIVALHHTYLSADPPCLEYEYIEGGDLAGLIQELHAEGRMKPDTANRLLLDLAGIVASAHRASPPIVHGDLKPANILVQRDEDGEFRLRVTDFGIGSLAAAHAARESRQLTRSRLELLTEAVRGAYTPLYASPQQMSRRSGDPADPRDDVHALGVIWLQMLTGDLGMMNIPPDWREQVEERGQAEDLIQLLASCIASKAARRPPTAAALAEQLKAILLEAEKRKQASQELDADLRKCERILLITGTEESFLREATPRRVNAWRAAAEQRSPVGQLLLGLCFDFGLGVEQDHAEALRWYRKAADQGFAAAQSKLGWMYRDGRGVEQDHAEALRWYRKAADQGDATAQYEIGVTYENGWGAAVDHAEALRWYRLAADKGFATAQNNIGAMYENGWGVAVDYAEALRWYQLAADQGDANAKDSIDWLRSEGLG
jgi:TPR repeat protein/tRNA A-37 threonylcarbamoyl transferase component Bud32